MAQIKFEKMIMPFVHTQISYIEGCCHASVARKKTKNEEECASRTHRFHQKLGGSLAV